MTAGPIGAGPAGSPVPAWTGAEMAHEACLFADDDQLAGRCASFISEGAAQGQKVHLVCQPPTKELIFDNLGSDAELLAWVTVAESLWSGGHETLLAWDALVRDMGRSGQPWRVIREPFWVDDADGREWHRFESAVNVLYADRPVYDLCLHDRRRLSAGALDQVRCTHPLVHDGSDVLRSQRYVTPSDYLWSSQPEWSDGPAATPAFLPLDPRAARDYATDRAGESGLAGRCDDVVLAVNELVTNCFEAGLQPELTCWSEADELVVTVSDRGDGGVDPVAGFRPPSLTDDSGRGLWLAWALSDRAALRSDPGGTQVRLFFRLPAGR